MELGANQPVAVVTGASSGIGKSTAGKLAALGWQVIGVGRDPQRCAAAEPEIVAAARAGGGFTMLRGDFTMMADVKRVADEVAGRTARLDVLINNAGGVRDRQIITAEGTEATFAANHLAPFLLTRELMPLLEASAASQPPGTTRVIAVSSSAHRVVGRTSTGTTCRASASPIPPSPTAGRSWPPSSSPANWPGARGRTESPPRRCIPAWSPATSPRTGMQAMQAHMAAAPTVAPDEPAETLAWLATDPEGGRDGGRYFYRKAEETPTDAAQDEAAAARLWTETEALLAKLGF